MITDIAEYFRKGCGRCDRFATPDCSVRAWASGLADLRQICVGAELVETVKWGHPCYMHAERNIAIIGAFRGDFRLTFFNAALMVDPDKVLEKQGPNTRHANMIRVSDNTMVAKLAPVIRAYLIEAMGYAVAGVTPAIDDRTLDLPDDLLTALDGDADLAEAFQALTPGRQKSYVIALSSAKTAATRVARIAKYRGHILAGKGVHDR